MSAILGVFELANEPVQKSVARSMLASMARRGLDNQSTWCDGTALLSASRYQWETNILPGGDANVARHGHLAGVADATLYYRDDLRRRLGISRNEPNADSPSHLILFAYEKWGERCVDFLEGDFACVVWDAKARRVFLTRDFTGQRPLFYSQRGTTLVVASTLGGVVAHPSVRSDLNLAAIAIDASALIYSAGNETCYSDVSVVPAGSTVIVAAAGSRVTQWWEPVVRTSGATPLAEAAEELRTVLGEAVLQRTGENGVASVWLSGGRDSTAVFAAGQHAISSKRLAASLRPVSLRLDAADPLNEDRFIEAVAGRWQSRVTWMDVAELGPLVQADGSGDRDEPYAHLYENLIRQLSERSLTSGARVALNGNGGDVLFEVSHVIVADYLASLRIRSVLHEWSAVRTRGRRLSSFVQWAVTPLLPTTAQNAVARIRGRPLHRYFERPVPSWLMPSFVKEHDIVARARAGSPRTTSGSRSQHEMRWFLTEPHFTRSAAICAEYALETGVELRTPMLDARVVRLAASRPASERRSQGQTKILLRRAMAGLLPEFVLAPRAFKTGTLRTYSAHAMASLRTLMRQEFHDPMLAALGIASASELNRVSERFLAGTVPRPVAEQLVRALQCELWLKARLADNRSVNGRLAAAAPSLRHDDELPLEVCASNPAARASGTSRQLSGGGL
jgi:asparagine synthase (glutamine-hydrolysing)